MLIPLILLFQSPSALQIVDSVRQAVGYESIQKSPYYQASGKANLQGVDSTVTFAFGLEGEYVFATDGPLGQSRAFDGKAGWETDFGGAPVTLTLSDLQHQHAISWVFNHEWLDPQGPLEVSIDTASAGGDSYTLNLKLKDGIHVQKVIVDKKSWLPIETSFEASGMKVSYSIKSWIDAKGFKFPKRVETQEGNLKGWIEFAECRSASRLDFGRPSWSLISDTTWSEDGVQKLETRKTRTGHILVKPTIGGKDVGWFILDSGAGGMAIDSGAVEALGGLKFGEINVGGVGGFVSSNYVTLKDFRLGGLTVSSMNFIDIDLKMIAGFFGVKLGGIVGYEFFRRAVAEIDLETGDVSIANPATFFRDPLAWSPLVLDGRHPTFVGEYEGGRSGRFRLDTGANGTVTFNSPTVERYGLLSDRSTVGSAVGGVGGTVRVESGDLSYFTLGGKKFENVKASFATSKTGVFGEDYLAGNIGQDLLKAFTIVFDYANERIALISKDGSSAR